MSEGVIFEPGDVFVTRSETLLGKLIRRFQQSKGEPRTVVNHMGMFLGVAGPREAHTLEALWTVKLRPFLSWLPGHLTKGGHVWVFRNAALTRKQQLRIASYAWRTYPAGTRYGWWKLLLHAAGLKRMLRLRKRPICSFLVGDAYEQEANYRFGGIPGMELQPDDAWDVMMREDYFTTSGARIPDEDARDDTWRLIAHYGPGAE